MAQSIQELAVAVGLAEAKRGVFETNNDNRGPDEVAVDSPGDGTAAHALITLHR